MPITPRTRRLRTTAAVAAVVLVLLGLLHFWFSQNAARYLEGVVSDQSNGKLQLKVKGFSYNLATGFIEIRKGTLRSLDSASGPATYNIRLDRLTLHLQSFFPLLLERRLLLDSVSIQQPQIEINRWRKDPDLLHSRDQVSLPSELGRLYRSLLDGLEAMELKRIRINGAGVVLNDRMKPGSPPVRVRGIDFFLQYPGGASKAALRNPDNRDVKLFIPGQRINFPDGKHHIAFKQLQLERFGQRLLLDSCTVATRNLPGQRTGFHIFFTHLLLSGMDFDALYRTNTIKADSVFCTRPRFNLTVYKDSVRQASATARPAPQLVLRNVVEDLGADLDLGFIGVRNAGFLLRFNSRRQRTISNTSQDDFTIRGLRVKPDSTKPFTISQFDMMVRGYELYNEDSSAIFRFDSVQFKNDRIILRQFSATTLNQGKRQHNERRYTIPYFELQDIDWVALAFEEKLQAKNAYLVNPDIYFRALKPRQQKRKQSLFEILETAGELLSLEEIHVRNGTLHLIPNSRTDIRLTNANLVLRTPSLLAARSETGIKKSIQELAFGQGTVQQESGTITLKGVNYLPATGLLARELHIRNKNVEADLQDVSLSDALVDRQNSHITLQQLQWQRGTIDIRPGGSKPERNGDLQLQVQGLKAGPTQVRVNGGATRMSVQLRSFSLASFSKPAGKPFALEGMGIEGLRFSGTIKDLDLAAAGFSWQPNGSFRLSQLELHRQIPGDTLAVEMPALSGITTLEGLLQGAIRLDKVQSVNPRVVWRKKLGTAPGDDASKKGIHIGLLELLQPQADLTLYQGDSVSRFKMERYAEGKLRLQQFSMANQEMTLAKLLLHSGPALFENKKGRRLGTEQGTLFLEASNLNRTGKGWSGTVDSVLLQKPSSLLLGGNASLQFSHASAGNISLPRKGSGLQELWQHPQAWLRTGTGTFRDSTTVLYWEDARYDAARQRLSIDSVALRPAVTREAFIATHPFQADYITFQSGPIVLTGFDRQRFETEQFVGARTVTVQRPVITLYRDKRPPFQSGINKPLPTNKLKALPIPVDIGLVILSNGLVAYTELNEKTNEEGIITLTHLNATINNIRNQNLSPTDSLYLRMDALLLDSAQLSLQLKQSYADSLAGFLMSLRMRPTSLSFLNPVVAPLSSVNIISGKVDSLYLNAIGREQMALGEMHLFYRDLKVKLVQFGDNRKSKVLLGALSFLANNLVIRKNNNGRKSLMYVERLRDRSVFNYLIKMTMSGIASGVGVKSNRRILKQYRKDLERLQAPHFVNEARMEALVKENNEEKAQDKK